MDATSGSISGRKAGRMSDLKVILTILGLAVLIAFVYALFTLGLAWVIGRKGDETDFFYFCMV